MSIVLQSTGGGQITLLEPTTASNFTQTLPAASGTVALTNAPVFTGQATIPTINLTGGQITFPATQSASSDANTLDDYEEGTFTLTSGGGTGNTARYIKIGNAVTVYGDVTFTGVTSASSAIAGLPFSTNGQGAMAITYTNLGQVVGAIFIAGTSLNLYNQRDTLVNITNNGRIIFNATYVTS